MFKSIFSKYFTVIALIVVVSFTAMGGMQLLFFTRYWAEEKEVLLSQNAQNIAAFASEGTTVAPDGTYLLSSSTMNRVLPAIAEAIDAVIFITDNGGSIILSSKNKGAPMIDQMIEGVALSGDKYFSVGTMNGLFRTRQYIAGSPIVLRSGTRVGYAFLATPADNLTAYLADNLRIFLLSALGVLTLAFIVLYILTYRLARPLRQMAAATRSFGAGDFSYRLPVRGKDELAELATALNNMAVSLSSVEGMSRSFVANVSHELKTPMTTIAGFIDGILDGTIPADKRAHYLRIVSDEIRRLSRLVKSMLDLSRIDNGELRISPVRFDLTEVVCTALLSFEPRVEQKRIGIVGLEDCPRVEVSADFDLIGQVVYNLMDNAVKFTNEGGSIALRVSRQDGRAVFTIRNTGPGLPPDELPHIFERFYKSDKSRSLDKNGVGLGLYIVKSVINLHHGEIMVRSNEGEYCEFTFWLPDRGDNELGRG